MLVLIKSNQQKDPEPNFDDGFPVLGQSEILNTPTPWLTRLLVLGKSFFLKSEIPVKQIRVYQGVGVHIFLTLGIPTIFVQI